jgi:hypothetical protein
MAASTLAASTAHLGRTRPTAAEELVAVSSRCAEFAETITAAALYDWDSPQRLRELSASRMPTAHEAAEIASRLYRAVAPALDLPHPDPEAVRLASLASQIAPLASDASHAERKSVLATAEHRWCCRPRTAASLRAGMRRSPRHRSNHRAARACRAVGNSSLLNMSHYQLIPPELHQMQELLSQAVISGSQ